MRAIITCLLFLSMICLCSCSTRENAKSLKFADTGIEASLMTLQQPDFSTALAGMEDAESARLVIETLNRVGQFLVQARDNIAAPLTVLAEGEPVNIGTTAEQALLSPATFLQEASKQSARAEVEAQTFLWWHNAIGAFKGYLTGEQGLLVQLLSMLGIGGGTAATIAAGARHLVKRAKVKYAEHAYQTEIQDAPSDKIGEIKERHKRVQQAQGIHGHIARKLEKQRAPS